MAYTSINKSSDYFNTKLTTGTGSSQAVTGLGFQPDFIWGKRRDSTGHHTLFDVVRGITKGLETTSQGAEFTSTDYYDSFDSDGFTIAAGASGAGNGSGQTAVQWSWLAGGTASSNTDGSITSSVSANTTSGFSIITYTGTGSTGTIGHGLNSAPELVILRNREVSSSWWVWGELLGNVNIMELQSTAAKVNPNGNYHNDTMPTSSVISIGSDGQVSGSGQSHICYAFHSVKGYSKIGSYTGNGNADGTFVYTGFKPAWVVIKASTQTADWVMFDNKRNPFNLVEKYLDANTSDAEGDDSGGSGSWELDFVSNGFKLRENSGGLNQNGTTFIYMAFAENPFTTSTGVPTTAR